MKETVRLQDIADRANSTVSRPTATRRCGWPCANCAAVATGEWFKENKPEVVQGYDPRIVAWLENLGYSVSRNAAFVHLWNPETDGEFAGLYHNPPEIGAGENARPCPRDFEQSVFSLVAMRMQQQMTHVASRASSEGPPTVKW